MPLPSEYDRYYRVLGLEPGASLAHIEEAWKARFAASHPDKFAAGSKRQATARAQEISNARDELRRYWRAHAKAPPTRSGYSRAAPPRPEPSERAEPRPAAAAPPEPAAERRFSAQDERPPPPKRDPAFPYAAATALGLFALIGSFALLPGGTESGAAPTPPPPVMHAETGAPLAPDRVSTSPAPEKSPPPIVVMTSPEAVPVVAEAPPAAAPSASPPTPEKLATAKVAAVADDRGARGEGTAAGSAALGTAAPGAITASPAPAVVTDPAPKRGRRVAQSAPAGQEPNSYPAPAPYLPPADSPFWSSGQPPRSPAPTAQPRAPGVAPSAPPYASPSPGGAGSPGSRGPAGAGPRAAMQACRGDLQTYCANLQPGGGRIAQCLRQHFQQLSPGCSSALRELIRARQGGGNPQSPRYNQ